MGQVAKEVAEQEFERFTTEMDLDVRTESMDAEDRAKFDNQRALIVRCIESGRIYVDEKGQPVFTPNEGNAITFYEPTGASFMAMDGQKKDAGVAKTFSLLGDMTHTNAKLFSQMPNRDLKICQALLTLFLG